MPSARMAPDGQLSIGASYLRNIQHYNFDFQVLPWLAGGFLYSGLNHYDTAYPVYWDRSFSFKARLFQESAYLPALAFGVNDLVGTGIYSGEYVVASKQFGTVDATIGLGWGRYATTNSFTNPLGLLSNSFKSRVYDSHIGETNSQYFHGPAGLFGGVSWETPVENLTLLVEYNSDDYSLERGRGTFAAKERYNLGLSYKPLDAMAIGVNWVYGSSINANLSLALNPKDEPFPARMGATLPPTHIRSGTEQQQAINNLLRERSGALRAARIAASNRNALVDALWNGGMHDVSLSGRSLLVNATGVQNQELCAQAALLVAHYDMTIDSVGVQASGKTKKCDVPTLVRPALYVTEDASKLSGLDLAPPTLTMIDASGPAPATRTDALAAIQKHAAEQEISLQALSITDSEAIVYYTNLKYQHEKDAVDRLVRILMADTPPTVEKFRLVALSFGLPNTEFDILRGPTERSITQGGRYSLVEGGNTIIAPPLQNPVLAQAERGTYPRFSWTLFPLFRQALFDPDNPLAVQFLATARGAVEIQRGLNLIGQLEYSVYDNFSTSRPSDSVLPHVRTDWTRFFVDGKNGIGELSLQYQFRLSPEIYARASAGYLESMFAGVGGEVLWRPEYSRWAVGVDMYHVKQRSFDRLFGLQKYSAFTGHAAIYYASPWYDINFALRAGQYLAGDRGVTFELSRRFASTGVELGVFATKTNVSAAQFGEGSFDKGFIIRIPIGWSLPVHTQSELATIIRPLQRDGGQRMAGDAVLYDALRRSGFGDSTAAGEIVTSP